MDFKQDHEPFGILYFEMFRNSMVRQWPGIASLTLVNAIINGLTYVKESALKSVKLIKTLTPVNAVYYKTSAEL